VAAKKRRIKIVGTVFDVTDGINLAGEFAAGWNFSAENEVQQIPYSNKLTKNSLPVGKNYSAEVRISELTPGIVARLTGGSAANTRREKTIEVITKVTNSVTLSNGDGANQSIIKIIRIRDVVNKTDRYVAGTAVAGDAVTISGAVLTCHASDTGTQFEVEYEWQDTSASVGTYIIDPPTTLPGKCELHFCYGLQDVDSGLVDKYLIIQCKKCQPKSHSIGGDAQADGIVPIAFDIVNESSGDVTYWWSNYNPTATHA